MKKIVSGKKTQQVSIVKTALLVLALVISMLFATQARKINENASAGVRYDVDCIPGNTMCMVTGSIFTCALNPTTKLYEWRTPYSCAKKFGSGWSCRRWIDSNCRYVGVTSTPKPTKTLTPTPTSAPSCKDPNFCATRTECTQYGGTVVAGKCSTGEVCCKEF